jgi:glycerol uptake facilitator-like aquaporin
MTTIFLFIIFAVSDPVRGMSPSGIPAVIGFGFVTIAIAFGWQTGFAMNPARDFGPRCFIGMIFGNAAFQLSNYYFWVPIVATTLGGIFGGGIYRTIFN